jgi:hypothetical protein
MLPLAVIINQPSQNIRVIPLSVGEPPIGPAEQSRKDSHRLAVLRV